MAKMYVLYKSKHGLNLLLSVCTKIVPSCYDSYTILFTVISETRLMRCSIEVLI